MTSLNSTSLLISCNLSVLKVYTGKYRVFFKVLFFSGPVYHKTIPCTMFRCKVFGSKKVNTMKIKYLGPFKDFIKIASPKNIYRLHSHPVQGVIQGGGGGGGGISPLT